MSFRHFLQHERHLWHRHFIPSIIAGLAVAVITSFYNVTPSNVVLFASIGASAMILTNTESHHLTKLRSSIIAYTAMIIIALFIRGINTIIAMPDTVNVFFSVTLVGIVIILADAFHPPAISASLSFTLFELPLTNLFWLFLSVIMLLFVARLMTYTLSQKLSLKEFEKEFVRTF